MLLFSTSDFICIGIVALPLTMVIVSGGIDISFGSTIGLCAIALGVLFQSGVPMPLAMVDEFIEVFRQNHLGSVQEEGNLRFDVLQDPEVNSRFYIYEAYKDEDAVAFHKTTPHYKTCVAKLEALSRPIKRDYDHILKTLLTNYL